MPSGKREAKVATLPLVGDPTQRNFNAAASLTSGLDQRFRGCQFVVVPDPQKQTKNVYVEKRPGIESAGTIVPSRTGHAISDNFALGPSAADYFCCAIGTGTPSTDSVFQVRSSGSQGSMGALTASTIVNRMSIGWFSNIPTILMTASTTPSIGQSDRSGWFSVASTGMLIGTFTADTVSGNPDLTNVSSTSFLFIGQELSGTGITAGTRIQSISGTTVTMTANATANGSGVTVTRTGIAKIISTNFPTGQGGPVGKMEELNGRAFALMESSGAVYNSGLNEPWTWPASAFLAPRRYKGYGVTLQKYKTFLLVFTSSGVSFFYDNGNPSGSVLNEQQELAFPYGVNSGYPIEVDYQLPVSSVGDYVFWTTPDFNIGVWTLAGYEPKKISGVIEDRILAGSSTSSFARIQAYQQNGQTYLFCYNGTNQLLYHVESGMWSDPVFSLVPYIGNAPCTVGTVISGGTEGKFYRFSDQTPVYTDDGSAFTMTIQTDTWDGGTQDWKQIERIELIGDTQSSGTTTLQISGDDYANFTTIGSFDMTQPRKELFSGGWYQGSVAFKLTNSANTPFRAQALRITYKTGLA